jgi:hypothetical protein
MRALSQRPDLVVSLAKVRAAEDKIKAIKASYFFRINRVWSDGLPPKPIYSDTSGLARLRFAKWCLPSNEREWFDDSPESLVASKCWSLPSCSRSYVDPIPTDQNRWAKSAESGLL